MYIHFMTRQRVTRVRCICCFNIFQATISITGCTRPVRWETDLQGAEDLEHRMGLADLSATGLLRSDPAALA
jgi:hypothetical protein